MNEFKYAHIYVKSWLLAMLAEHDEHTDFISGVVHDFFDVFQDRFLPLTNVKDFAFLMETQDAIYLSVSGTKNLRAWADDARIFFPVRGFHRGFRDSFYDLIAKPLVEFISNSKKPIVCTGHSRGESISKYGAFYLRDELKLPDVQHIGFCGPHLTNTKGFDRCKAAKLRSTRIWIDKGDIVDDVGSLAGKHYGYSVELPYCGHPGVSENAIVDSLIMGHAPSYVTKCLKQLFVNWNKQEQVHFLNNIEQFATR
jgi:hypothetical protein